MRHRRLQLVMQDPADALSPRLPVEELVREPLDLARTGDCDQRMDQVAEALDSVGLPSTGPSCRLGPMSCPAGSCSG